MDTALDSALSDFRTKFKPCVSMVNRLPMRSQTQIDNAVAAARSFQLLQEQVKVVTRRDSEIAEGLHDASTLLTDPQTLPLSAELTNDDMAYNRGIDAAKKALIEPLRKTLEALSKLLAA